MCNIIVKNIGYLKVDEVCKLSQFSIYLTTKKNLILVKDINMNDIQLFYPKKDRLPYKITEGKKICRGVKVFDSTISTIDMLNTSYWNGGNQIISYEQF